MEIELISKQFELKDLEKHRQDFNKSYNTDFQVNIDVYNGKVRVVFNDK